MVKFDKNPYSGQRMTEKDHRCGQLTTSNLAFDVNKTENQNELFCKRKAKVNI